MATAEHPLSKVIRKQIVDITGTRAYCRGEIVPPAIYIYTYIMIRKTYTRWKETVRDDFIESDSLCNDVEIIRFLGPLLFLYFQIKYVLIFLEGL